MRVATVATALFAAGAVAGPVAKRAYETVWTTVVVTVGVPPGYHIPEATPAPKPYVPVAEPEAHVPQPPKNEYKPPQAPRPAPVPAPAPKDDYQPPKAPSSNAPNDYAREAVEKHNEARRQHGAQDLVWNQQLADYAQRWVNDCNGVATKHHNTYGQRMGQNMYGGGDDTCKAAIEAWYDKEEPLYRSMYGKSNAFSMATGHFSQVIWKDTKEVGCATNNCGNMKYTICNYSPPGNVGGQYAENVSPRGGY